MFSLRSLTRPSVTLVGSLGAAVMIAGTAFALAPPNPLSPSTPGGSATAAFTNSADHDAHTAHTAHAHAPTQPTDRATATRAGSVSSNLSGAHLSHTSPAAPIRCERPILLSADKGSRLCSHGEDPAPPGVDIHRYVSTEELIARASKELSFAHAGAGAAPSTDGSGQIVCEGNGVSGARVQALYVVASDRTDRFSQVLPSLRKWAVVVDARFNASADATGGARHVRFVTRDCQLSILRVVVPPKADDSVENTIQALIDKGFKSPDRRYLVWADANKYCGVGTLFLDDSPGASNANNGAGGAAYSRIDTGCWGYAEAHELMHNLGGVQPSAPHATPSGHCTDDSDVMCYDDDGAGPVRMRTVCAASQEIRFDCNRDDYFSISPKPGSYLATHWNTARSRFLIDPIDRTPPPVPTGMTATSADTSVALRWNAVEADDLGGYQVFRDGRQVAALPLSNTPGWIDSGRTHGVMHSYQVRALDLRGNASALSSVLRTSAIDRTPPRAPQNLVYSEQNGRLLLSWAANSESDLRSYRVLRDDALAGEQPAPGTSWRDPDNTAVRYHNYRVVALDRAGNISPPSETIYVLATPAGALDPRAPGSVLGTLPAAAAP